MVAHADLVHPLLDDLQGRSLLRHEQDGLALVHGVGYDVGDCLGLSGSGRSVHDERLALSGRPHRFDLGPVGGHAEAELVRVGVDADLRVGVIDPAGHQRVHDGVLLEPLDVLVQVLPHRVLAEREHSQGGSVEDLPSLHPLDASADVLRDAVHVDPGFVQGERLYARYHDVVFLAKLLGEGDVENRLLVVLDDGVSLLLLHQLRRDQYERRVAGDLLSLALEPSEHSDGHEEGVASALLHLLPVEAVDRFYGRKGLPVGERGPDPSSVDLVHAGFGVVADVGLGLERPLGVDLGPVPVLGLGHHEELAAVVEDVLEERGVGYQQGHGLGSDLHVDQGIPGGGVQKVALPHVDAGEGPLLDLLVDLSDGLGGSDPAVDLVPVRDPHAVLEASGGEGRDGVACLPDVDGADERIRVLQPLQALLAGVVEGLLAGSAHEGAFDGAGVPVAYQTGYGGAVHRDGVGHVLVH